jgi:hypothetical protein
MDKIPLDRIDGLFWPGSLTGRRTGLFAPPACGNL